MSNSPLYSRLILCLTLSLVSLRSAAQDFHFSDPTRSLTFFNPAYTGFTPDGAQHRITTVARSQWSSVLESSRYRTAAAAYDGRICGQKRGDYFAFGVNFALDGQGDPTLRRTDAFFSGSYTRRVGGSYDSPDLIGIGTEIGWIQYHLDGIRDRTFDEQFDDPNAPGEFLSAGAVSNFDVGVGLFALYSGNDAGLHDINLGASVKHLPQPALGFFGTQNNGGISSDSTAQLNRRINLNASASFAKSTRKSISAFLSYSNQRPHNQLLARVMFNALGVRELSGTTKSIRARTFSFGVAARITGGAVGLSGDALIGIAQLHNKNFILSLAYDYNISSLNRSTDGNGAVELAGTILLGRSSCLHCPPF